VSDVALRPWPGGSYALRPVCVVADLDQLRGPVSGRFVLPLHLNASAPREFDFADARDRADAYQLVLLEAASDTDLTSWLVRAELERLWPELYLPRGVRRAWQDAHPSLARIGPGPHVPQP
jgi:hypothetical protein